MQHSVNEKCGILDDFCYAELLAYYTLENRQNKTCEYCPDELDYYLLDNNHGEFYTHQKLN